MGVSACKPLRADETQKITFWEKKKKAHYWGGRLSINCSSLHCEMATLLKSGAHWWRSGFLPVGILNFTGGQRLFSDV